MGDGEPTGGPVQKTRKPRVWNESWLRRNVGRPAINWARTSVPVVRCFRNFFNEFDMLATFTDEVGKVHNMYFDSAARQELVTKINKKLREIGANVQISQLEDIRRYPQVQRALGAAISNDEGLFTRIQELMRETAQRRIETRLVTALKSLFGSNQALRDLASMHDIDMDAFARKLANYIAHDSELTPTYSNIERILEKHLKVALEASAGRVLEDYVPKGVALAIRPGLHEFFVHLQTVAKQYAGYLDEGIATMGKATVSKLTIKEWGRAGMWVAAGVVIWNAWGYFFPKKAGPVRSGGPSVSSGSPRVTETPITADQSRQRIIDENVGSYLTDGSVEKETLESMVKRFNSAPKEEKIALNSLYVKVIKAFDADAKDRENGNYASRRLIELLKRIKAAKDANGNYVDV